ncbi:hypothetical protein THRCLA_09808 [Thraustotheca clavata]|uniref:Protein kinase domain-containing protein n=1 Tax=Thraustotheca clavata TaxID=74557 RepID=A0A1V9YU57_9STRA|nr:hypothetical protein THRCLA_09808 [Thraustotheca clavata]
MTMHALLTGMVPNNRKLTPDRLSSVGKDFLCYMLQKDPKKRLTAKQLLVHFWFIDHSALAQFVDRVTDLIIVNNVKMCGLCGTDNIQSTVETLNLAAKCLSKENLDSKKLSELVDLT